MKEKRKRGISPVIATVLLIAMVVIVGLIIFLWFRGLVVEGGEKFGKNLKLVCDDVEFDAEYSGNELSVVNTGNVPIFQLRLRLESDGSHETEEVDEYTDNWEEVGLGQGGTFSMSKNYALYDKLIVFPVLIGSSKEGYKTYVCEGQYGKEILI